ncbi:hypothetical protein GF325_19160, partial [Candidatus Bathyarchaeota archaeon]|nr:hypothetical protein [Candidatus Bathyarchaeota archaeon]
MPEERKEDIKELAKRKGWKRHGLGTWEVPPEHVPPEQRVPSRGSYD